MMVSLCEVCDCVLDEEHDMEDGCTILADCCGRLGMCEDCRKFGNHDCDDDPTWNEDE